MQTHARRIIYNDDGGAVKHMQSDDIAAMLAQRIKPLIDTQVDSVYYCGHDNFYCAYYPSELEWVELIGDDGLRKAVQRGADPGRELVTCCRENGLELFWSFRMNDIHESYGGNLSAFKREHPQWLLGSKDGAYEKRSIQYGIWSSVDFEVPEIREHVVDGVREVLECYELDGVEFDYGRNASLFRPTFDERAVEQRHLDILTQLQRDLRELGRQAGSQKKGRLPIAAVVPETVELCRYVGIDIERWLEEGLVDIIIAGNGYIPFSNAAGSLIELGHRHDVAVYSRLNLNTTDRLFWRHFEAWRAAATNFLQAGADGVYLINTYDAPKEYELQASKEIGELATLAGKDKLYAVDIDFETIAYGGGDVRYYMPREHICPMAIDDCDRSVTFFVGEDLAAAHSKGLRPTILLRVRIDNADVSRVQLAFNDQPLAGGHRAAEQESEVWTEFAVAPDQVKLGINALSARLASAPQGAPGPELPLLARVELSIKYA